jgi:hypothetical protein
MDANWHGACVLVDAAVLVADREAAAALWTLLEPHAQQFPVVARAVGCLGSRELRRLLSAGELRSGYAALSGLARSAASRRWLPAREPSLA